MDKKEEAKMHKIGTRGLTCCRMFTTESPPCHLVVTGPSSQSLGKRANG